MKRAILIGLLVASILVVSLAGAAGAGGQTDVEDSTERIITVEFAFDGYCDGMTLTFDTVTRVTTGVYGSSCATCPMADRLGGTFGRVAGSMGWTLSFETIEGSAPVWIWTRINKDLGTWTHYLFDGTVMNSGTWTECARGVQGVGSPSTSR